jgi:hypothetical protein
MTDSRPPSLIVCAAMKMKDGLIVPGVRHFSPEMRKVLKKMYGDNYHLLVQEQGFISQYGEFFNREDAWIIADKNNQIRRKVSIDGTLYSENLY